MSHNEKIEYNEALALINLMPSYDYYKIPGDKLLFLEEHSIKDFKVKEEDIKNNKLSRKAYIIYLQLYKKYIATEEENKKIDDILILNDKVKRQKYNNLFNKKEQKEYNNELIKIEKESMFKRLLKKIMQIFKQ